MTIPKEGDLQVWWIPQVLMKAFTLPVKDVTEAILVLDTLAKYDLFQYHNNIKPDYSNAGGLNVFENGEWVDWENAECEGIDEIMNKREQLYILIDE